MINGLFYRKISVSWQQEKGRIKLWSLIGRRWYGGGGISWIICTLLQSDNLASTLYFLRARCSFWCLYYSLLKVVRPLPHLKFILKFYFIINILKFFFSKVSTFILEINFRRSYVSNIVELTVHTRNFLAKVTNLRKFWIKFQTKFPVWKGR